MAQRIQHKRSSILGKRPAEQYLEPGELALNTNASDPGLFFETNNGEIAKAGPTSIGPQPPMSEVGYGPGESWYDTGNGTLNLWVPALNKWMPIASPLFGGSITAIFVGSEFPQATDDLSNDGYARPFVSLNRAMIEVARRSILRGRPDDAFNARFSIFLLPGKNVAYNEPGLTFSEFEAQTSVFVEDQALSQKQLAQFNPASGGVLVPRGTTIFGLDLRKTLICPTYYPVWTRNAYENEPETLASRSSILKWTGNSYLTSFTFRDKVGDSTVTEIAGQSFEVAVLRTLRPHGFRTLVTSLEDENEILDGDRVTLTYPDGISRFYDGVPTLPQGEYFAEPLDAYRLRLRKVQTGLAVLRNELPDAPVPGATPSLFLNLTVTLGTAHRLTAIEYANDVELDALYDKVQRAFSTLSYSGTASNAEVSTGETIIVASTPETPNIETNSVENSSPYVFNVSLRSQWGMCGMSVNGTGVGGFKSALSCNFTVVSVNNDPDVYEVYDDEEWKPLRTAYAESIGFPISETTREQALNYLVRTVKTDDIRFFYRSALDIQGQDGKSSGLVSELSDTRHYATMASDGGFVQIVSSFAIGLAVNYWTKSGGEIAVTNANSNFGGVALRAEGFSGIGTTGGALAPDTGFTIQGVRRPALITEKMVTDSTVKRFINTRIVGATNTTLTLQEPFYGPTILPYTLRDLTYIYVQDTRNGTEYRAQIDGSGSGPVTQDGFVITVVDTTNQIDAALVGGLDPQFLSLPYIKRFQDTRSPIDRQYSLWVQNTSQFHRPPQTQFILRFAEKPQTGVSNLVRPNTQLDPGLKGGWNHVFQVTDARTKREGDNPNGIEPLITPVVGTESYYVTIAQVDGFRPWVSVASNGYADDQPIFYANGQYSTYNGRLFYPQTNDLASGALKLPPNDDLSVWTRSKNFEVCAPIDETWYGAETLSEVVEDTYLSAYPDNATYPRGLQYELPDMVVNNVIDEDDGTPTLGIVTGGIVDPAKYDPWWSPSKMSMARLLRLLGFEYAQIDTMLRPQLWSDRNLPTASMPAVSGAGYALSTGTWPVEFNRPSVIRCGNHTWEWCGYINYTKGLPQYQTTQLSLRERFDFMQTALWGGQVYSTGTNEKGEYVFSGKTVAAGTGEVLLNTNLPLVPAPLPAPMG
jgi:hypothetical protein